MMMRKKSNPWARAKYLYVLPLVAISLVAFAHPEVSEMSEEISSLKGDEPLTVISVGVNSKETPQDQEEVVFDVVEEMPRYPGGQAELFGFIHKNVNYPEAAYKNGVQGRVIVSFIIAPDGTVREPKVMRSVDPELDAEALRVVSLMPKWKPGKQEGNPVAVRFTIPISFRLSPDEKAATANDAAQPAEPKAPGMGKNVVIVIDGKVSTFEESMKLKPEQIENVAVLKGETAMPRYGEKAKDGAVLITTKKK